MKMTKRKITLSDGRYLIYFKFSDKEADEKGKTSNLTNNDNSGGNAK